MSNLIEWLVMVLDELLIKPMTAFEPVCEAVVVVLVVALPPLVVPQEVADLAAVVVATLRKKY